MPDQLARLQEVLGGLRRREADRRGHHRDTVVGAWALAAALVAGLGCGTGPAGQTLQIIDRDRHAQFNAGGQSVVYYRHDERPGATTGIYRVELASGDVHLLVPAILAGLDVHPQTDSIVFSAYGTGQAEPALWLVGLDGGGLRRVGGGGTGPGYRWPAFSTDGTHIAWEARRETDTGLDTMSTLWIGEWRNGAIANARLVGPGRRSAWRPDGAALAVERRRPGGALPLVIALMDTTGRLLDTLGFGNDPVWRPDGGMLAYLADGAPDRGCLGVCFVVAGGSPAPLSAAFMSFTGGWSRDGAQFVYARRMRTYEIPGNPTLSVEESRLWIRTLATGTDRQVTF
jgi:Tol biopolymer transport system component